MKKKIIITLIILIVLSTLISNTFAADQIGIPQSSTEQGQAFNQLLDGEATVTSDGGNSGEQSEVVGVGVPDSQASSVIGSFTASAAIIPSMISRLLSAVALGGEVNLDDNAEISEFFTIGDLLTNKYPLFNINMFEETPEGPNSTLSNDLKSNVAIWFVALRNLAVIVCLISILYVGIRIAIATTFVDSSKYKKMLTSLCISFILLFVVHYIIILLINISELFVNLLTSSIGEDMNITDMEVAMLSRLPNETEQAEDWGKLFYLLLNYVIVYYEAKFFIMYIFRVFKVYIITIISPIVCITYSIDSMGDGRAQGFNNFIKRAIIDILIQPIHLILYIVFIYSAGEIATQVPLIGVIFIAALDNAEKVVRNIFKVSGKGLRDINFPPKIK